VKGIDNYSLINKIKHLAAENESLKERLAECELIAAARQKTILEQKLQLSENSEVKSRLDEELTATATIKNLISEIVMDDSGSRLQSKSGKDDLKYQLEEQKRQFVQLQSKLSDLQMQVQDLSNRNLALQQQSSRVAELESLLADAEQERDEWKALYNLRK
jgi:regulator of replication initiation timing